MSKKKTEPPGGEARSAPLGAAAPAPPYAFYPISDMHGATEEDLREMLLAFDTYIARRTSPTMDAFTREDIARVQVRRGTAHAYLGAWQPALADLDAVIAGNAAPGVVNTALLIRAEVYIQTRQCELAIADYSRLFALIEQVPPAEAERYSAQRVATCLGRGKLYALQERYEEALADFDRVLARDPSNTDALCARGLACAYAGRKDEGLADCNRALELEQASYCYHRRGVVHTLRWEFDAALADLATAQDLDPGNEQIQTDLAKARALWRLSLLLDVLPAEEQGGADAHSSG